MSIIQKALDKRRADSGGQPPPAPPTPDEPPRAEAADAATDAAGNEPAPDTPARRSREVTIDFGHLRRQGIMVPGERRSTLAEEFRLMKRPVLNNAFAPNDATRVPRGRLVMVTSALPREGKTFTTVNLALSMALEVERTVLLVDADVARPGIPDTLGIDADRGLMDVLTEPDITIPDVLLRTNVPNLSILPAGRPHGQSTELLASTAMMRLVNDLLDRYQDRMILFDSPPLLATSEPGVLATHMGQVLMVVEAEHTPRSSVERAMEQLSGCDVVLTTLNKATPLPGMGYGGYYYSRDREAAAHAH